MPTPTSVKFIEPIQRNQLINPAYSFVMLLSMLVSMFLSLFEALIAQVTFWTFFFLCLALTQPTINRKRCENLRLSVLQQNLL